MSSTVKIVNPLFTKSEYMKMSRLVSRRLNTKVDKIKNELIKEFMQHPVTQELMAGSAGSDYGGLYGFIGFPKGTNPTIPILEIFDKIKVLDKTPKITPKGQFIFDVYFPKSSEVFAVTPMPWASGRSWAQGVERGISGLGYFLSSYVLRKEVGRSGLGIQLKTMQTKGYKFSPQKYISSLLNKYEKKLKKATKL
jgi:hypothetical protein